MKIKFIWITNILMWIFLIASLIVKEYSKTAYWILYGCWAVFCISGLVLSILKLRELKKEEKELDQQLEEDRKHLEELIKGYLTISLSSENENKEDKE